MSLISIERLPVMGHFVCGDTASMPPIMVSREVRGHDGVRITIEWAAAQELHTRVADLAAHDLRQCALSRTEPLDAHWSVRLFQHPRAGHRVVLASLSARDGSAFRGVTIVDRDTEFIAIDVGADRAPRKLDGLPTLRPFRSDLAPLRGRRLRVLADTPTDDAGRPQLLPDGAQEVVADTDAVGPGLTVRVHIPAAPGITAHIAWDQLAFYDEPSAAERV